MIDIHITKFEAVEYGKPYVSVAYALMIDSVFHGIYETIMDMREKHLTFPLKGIDSLGKHKRDVIEHLKEWTFHLECCGIRYNNNIVRVIDINDNGCRYIDGSAVTRFTLELKAPFGGSQNVWLYIHSEMECNIDISQIRNDMKTFSLICEILNRDGRTAPALFEGQKIQCCSLNKHGEALLLRSLPEIKRLSFTTCDDLFNMEPAIVKGIIERLSWQKARTIDYMEMVNFFIKHGMEAPQITKKTTEEIEVFF